MTHGTQYAYRQGCRCPRCRKASREARARYRAGIRPGVEKGLQVHGKNGYSKHGCRCDICTEANRQSARDHYHRKTGKQVKARK